MTIAPVAAVTPVSPTIAPTGIEIKAPFQIDPRTGGVAFLSDDIAIYAQHIITIINTAYNERVMLPLYGTSVSDDVFNPVVQVISPTLYSDIMTAVQQYEPAVTIQNLRISPDPMAPTAVDIFVDFSVVPFSKISQVSLTLGGSVSQVVAP